MNLSERFQRLAAECEFRRNSHLIRRTSWYGVEWLRDGFDVLNYLNGKSQWRTLLAHRSIGGNPHIIRG